MSHSNPFALDTVRFLGRKTTDSDPFGDRDLVLSNNANRPPTVSRAQHLHESQVGLATLHNELLRQEALDILQMRDDEPQYATQQNNANVHSDAQLLSGIKQKLLQDNPANLINVLLFWINFQVSRGIPNHNQCVLNVLQDMKSFFVARRKPESTVVSTLNAILCTVVDNLQNIDYDSTEAVVDFVQEVGVYFMKEYLLERRVILPDIEAFDMLTTWVYFQYIMKRQLPPGTATSLSAAPDDIDQAQQLLNCMKMFEERVDVPVV